MVRRSLFPSLCSVPGIAAAAARDTRTQISKMHTSPISLGESMRLHASAGRASKVLTVGTWLGRSVDGRGLEGCEGRSA